ncbi:carboxymuconolactone decarboxylase family protein [Pseudonocardia kunmingensis]|uniref:AhpD family alkylhydroperoxidase n=1 Tax=Pseudonocardia kunmingensis TaxID=630975 RepID=A0A543DKQ4_9PSEU|nr:carboxymuconolactone decarboxylase family protein [Pseudonocardia kunmingensis]TQM09835.1 AhpD family alkylhydroperoxidase [Pseudonocardia kunmingensis]
MPRLTALGPDNTPSTSSALLAGIIDRHGDAGPMVRTMAHSPALLQGYLELSRAMKRAAIPRPLSEKISLAVQEWLGCALCLEAHTAAGRSVGLTDTDISLARGGTATDARDAALITYAARILTEPNTISAADVDELRRHGWSDRVLADVVGLVALNQLTGAFNLVAGLEPVVSSS